jgi:hypothetical protein
MIEMCLTRAELLKAIKQLDIAHANGFKHSLAIISLTKAGECVSDFRGEYDSLILRAHPTSQKKDWGRCHNPEWYELKDGQCVDKY